MGIDWSIRGAEVSLDFDLDPAAGQWSRVADGPTYTANGYSVTFEERNAADHTMIEFRPRYSNISYLYNATANRLPDPGESGSLDMNRRQCLLLRSNIRPGIAVPTDPVWWHVHEDNQLNRPVITIRSGGND